MAAQLAKKLKLTLCHLDKIAHLAGTNWIPRDKNSLEKEHQDFLSSTEQWIIEGNYSYLMKSRFSQATTIIWLDFKTSTSLLSYLGRTLTSSKSRAGNLEGAKNTPTYKQVKHILFTSSKNKVTYKKLIEESETTWIVIKNFKELNRYYNYWNLEPQK